MLKVRQYVIRYWYFTNPVTVSQLDLSFHVCVWFHSSKCLSTLAGIFICLVFSVLECENLYQFHDSIEKRLLTSLQCYEICERDPTAKSEKDKSTLVRRLGNCCNELSKFYMDNASHLYNECKLPTDLCTAKCKKFKKSILYFVQYSNFWV